MRYIKMSGILRRVQIRLVQLGSVEFQESATTWVRAHPLNKSNLTIITDWAHYPLARCCVELNGLVFFYAVCSFGVIEITLKERWCASRAQSGVLRQCKHKPTLPYPSNAREKKLFVGPSVEMSPTVSTYSRYVRRVTVDTYSHGRGATNSRNVSAAERSV